MRKISGITEIILEKQSAKGEKMRKRILSLTLSFAVLLVHVSGKRIFGKRGRNSRNAAANDSVGQRWKKSVGNRKLGRCKHYPEYDLDNI